MNPMKSILIPYALLICAISLPNTASATRVELGPQTGPAFEYNPETQYVGIRLKDLNLPEPGDDSGKLARFLKKLFVDRKQFGAAFIEVIPPFAKTWQKTVLFTYEWAGANRYKFRHIGATDGLGYGISPDFIFSDPVDIRIEIREWEDKAAGSAVKTILDAVNETPLAAGYGAVVSNATLMIDLAQNLFKPDEVEEALRLRLDPRDISNRHIQILGDGTRFFTLELRSSDGYFDDFDLEKGIRRAGISGLQTWQQMIRNTDRHLGTDGKTPLVAMARSYADHIASLGLNRRDQAIFTACSLCAWAGDAVNGAVMENGRPIYFSANDYAGLTTGDLGVVRGSACDFTGVDCRTENCLAMVDFINKCAKPRGRGKAAALYLDGELALTFQNTEHVLNPAEFITDFSIRRQAYFTSKQVFPGRWEYTFEPGNLDLRYQDQRYKSARVVIGLSREVLDGKPVYSISGIEIFTDLKG